MASLGAAVVFLCAIALLNAQGMVLTPAGSSSLHPRLPVDFAAAVYYPARAFLDGLCPYDGPSYIARYPTPHAASPYLPGVFLLHAPLALMPPRTASVVYEAVTIALTVVLAYVALRLSEAKAGVALVLVVASVILLSRPGRLNLVLGQVTLEFVLAAYVALATARTRPWLSAIGLAVAMFKPTFGFPLALFMLALGAWRAVVLGIAVGVVINLPLLALLSRWAGGVIVLGAQLMHTAIGMEGAAVNDPTVSPFRVDAVSLFSRLTGRSLGAVAQLLVAGIVLGVAAWVLRVRLSRDPPHQQALAASIICCAVLLSVYHQAYDLVLLAWPFLALVYHRVPREYDQPWVRWPLLALFTFLTLNYLGGLAVLRRFGLLAGSSEDPAVASGPLATALGAMNGLALFGIFGIYVGVALLGGRRLPLPTAARV